MRTTLTHFPLNVYKTSQPPLNLVEVRMQSSEDSPINWTKMYPALRTTNLHTGQMLPSLCNVRKL